MTTVYLDDGTEFEAGLHFEPTDDEILFAKRVDRRTVIVGYLVHDDMPLDYRDWLEDGMLTEFRSQNKRDDFIANLEAEGRQYFIVDKYAHGGVHYSVQNTRWYPHRHWDVAPCAVFVPPQDLQEQYHKDKYKRGGKKAARETLLKYANAVLEEYSQLCNGDVWGIVVATMEEAGGIYTVQKSDECWGFIGYDYAKEELKDQFDYAVNHHDSSEAEALDDVPFGGTALKLYN